MKKQQNSTRYIFGTKPEWGYELPGGYLNSMVSSDGRGVNAGWNYDERDDDERGAINSESSFETLAQARTLAEKVKEKVAYTGIFVDGEKLYSETPAHLENTIRNPHVTINFAPDEAQLHLDELGKKARIFVTGYGNNGKNEGLLVKVETDDPVIQKMVNQVKIPHITLSYSKDSHPMYTSDLEFYPLKNPFELDGEYCLHLKNSDGEGFGPLVNSINELNTYL